MDCPGCEDFGTKNKSSVTNTQEIENQPVSPQVEDHKLMEYDFVEQPSRDFFCPVTFEPLIDPHQTTCCGNHLSQEAVNTLQRDGKPCPMCKEAQLNTVPDKFYKRRVSEVRVRCPYKKSGCEWVGEVGTLQQHSQSCPKRPWQCQYCDLAITYDIGTNEHIPKCTMYPEPCPNSCEIGTVPRCDVEKHKMVCPLEIVSCGYADVGCDVQVCRRDLARHMEEGQQQHLLSATLLNLQLTRDLNEKIDELQEQLKSVQDECNGLKAKITTIEQQVFKSSEDTQEHLKIQDKHVESVRRSIFNLQGFTLHEFTLREFSKCQAQGGNGDWYSEPFYSPEPQAQGSYKFHLYIRTNGESTVRGVYMSILLWVKGGNYDDKLSWPVNVTAHIQLVNQLGEHNHHERTITGTWSEPSYFYGKTIEKYIKHSDLGFNADKNTHYLKDNCLHFLVYFKVQPQITCTPVHSQSTSNIVHTC